MSNAQAHFLTREYLIDLVGRAATKPVNIDAVVGAVLAHKTPSQVAQWALDLENLIASRKGN